jgi:hypothetical protein
MFPHLTGEDGKRRAITPDHREYICHKCGGDNVLWFGPDEAWNDITKRAGYERDIVLCPRCFAFLAEEHGWHVELYRAEVVKD